MAAKPLSKTKIVSHLAEKVGTPKKTAAAWLYDLLKPHVARLVVCNPRRNAGEAIKIKAKTVVRLRTAKAFKDAVLGTSGTGPRG